MNLLMTQKSTSSKIVFKNCWFFVIFKSFREDFSDEDILKTFLCFILFSDNFSKYSNKCLQEIIFHAIYCFLMILMMIQKILPKKHSFLGFTLVCYKFREDSKTGL